MIIPLGKDDQDGSRDVICTHKHAPLPGSYESSGFHQLLSFDVFFFIHHLLLPVSTGGGFGAPLRSIDISRFNERTDVRTGDIRQVTLDIEKLYESIDQNQCIELIRRLICRLMVGTPRWGARLEFILDLMRIVFMCQVVSFRRVGSTDVRLFFLQQQGVATGLNCAVQLANLFLVAFDEYLLAEFGFFCF